MSKTDYQYRSHPSMFRASPVGFILLCILVPFVIGAVLLLIWWIRTCAVTLEVSATEINLTRGLLSKHTDSVNLVDVRNVQIDQTFFQRLFGVGSISIGSSATAGFEIVADGIPHPEAVKALIDAARQNSRPVKC